MLMDGPRSRPRALDTGAWTTRLVSSAERFDRGRDQRHVGAACFGVNGAAWQNAASKRKVMISPSAVPGLTSMEDDACSIPHAPSSRQGEVMPTLLMRRHQNRCSHNYNK